MAEVKICAYVQRAYAKATYKKECFNTRQWVGLCVIIDALERAGYTVDFADAAGVAAYDYVLVSITSDCDWWSFVAERLTWPRGHYKVLVGGAGVLNIRPFLPYADYFMLGRGERSIVEIIRDGGEPVGVVDAAAFSPDKTYMIRQEPCYPHEVTLANGRVFKELSQGCPHKCLFCGYSWQRQYVGGGDFAAGSGLWSNPEVVRERAIIDMNKSGDYDLSRLRITSIDGFSERLRRNNNKLITRDMLRELFRRMAACERPHQLKLYNVVGLPGETMQDWMEFVDDLSCVDASSPRLATQWGIVLHSTPFRPMPATPMACAPASFVDYRGAIARELSGGKYSGTKLFFKGNAFYAVEGMGTESLSTHALSMICHRGTEADSDNIAKIACSSKFNSASTMVKVKTLDKYFDLQRLFREQTPEELPSRYLRTYCAPERLYPLVHSRTYGD